MFKKVANNVVKATDGYIVKYGHHTLTYTENDQYVLSIEIEYDADPFCMVVYASHSIKNWDDHQDELIAEDKKAQIIDRIKAALEFLKIKYEIE